VSARALGKIKMSGSIKLGLIIIGVVLALGLALQVVRSLWGFILPVGIFAGIGLVIYGFVGRKSLGGSRRRYLP
jgi:hypothetical protein